jgi:cytochrome c peroxidase
MNRCLALLVAVGCSCTLVETDGRSVAARRLGTPEPLAPDSPARVELGRRLFFDPALSRDRSLSCASCHRPELGLGDGRTLAVGLGGKTLRRHAPSLYNLAYGARFFWDGRAGSLEEQARLVLENPDEMGMPLDALVPRLRADVALVADFDAAYPGQGLAPATVTGALSAFERSLVAREAPFDRWLAGEEGAMSAASLRGLDLFLGKANCVACHAGPNFTDGKFHNTGVPSDDPGRLAVVRNIDFSMRPYPFFGNRGAFKTPSLRNAKLSPPYFHDGSEPTLEAVVRFYNRGGKGRDVEAKSPDVRPLGLSDADVKDLVEFLESLTSPLRVDPPRPR